jgi:hypothetical protein
MLYQKQSGNPAAIVSAKPIASKPIFLVLVVVCTWFVGDPTSCSFHLAQKNILIPISNLNRARLECGLIPGDQMSL